MEFSRSSLIWVADARGRAEREGLPCRFEAADLNFAELPKADFDVVYAHASIHHVLNLEHLVWQVYRTLAPGGRFVVTTSYGRTLALERLSLFVPCWFPCCWR